MKIIFDFRALFEESTTPDSFSMTVYRLRPSAEGVLRGMVHGGEKIWILLSENSRVQREQVMVLTQKNLIPLCVPLGRLIGNSQEAPGTFDKVVLCSDVLETKIHSSYVFPSGEKICWEQIGKWLRT